MHQRALGLSQWTVTAAGASSEQPRGAPLLGTTLGHLWECAFNCLMLVQLWLELAGRHTGFYSEGLHLSVSLSFCCNLFFFFFKGDMCSSSVPQVGIMFV